MSNNIVSNPVYAIEMQEIIQKLKDNGKFPKNIVTYDKYY